MDKLKSHFEFSRKTRNGIFLLVLVIVCLQCIYFFVDFPSDNTNRTYVNEQELKKYRTEIDSLRAIAKQNSTPKIYPFNPNFITDYKGYVLGMSNQEIDRLHRFRSKDKWVNSAKDFQRVTKVSDSLLNSLVPYFKFPDWVNKNTKKEYQNSSYTSKSNKVKLDLNTATAEQLKKVYGIGDKLSKRIVVYREKHQGFANDIELSEIWGLSPEVIANIKKQFLIKTPRKINAINLNTATRDQLVIIPYIDYEIASNIIEERTLRDGFTNLDDLIKVEDFPLNKIEIIKLYLYL